LQKLSTGSECELKSLRAEVSALKFRLENAEGECSRLRREQASRSELYERYHLAFLGAQDGLWDFYLDGRSSFVSERCKQILGYEEADIGGDYKFWWRKIHLLDRHRAHKALVNHLYNREPYDLAIRMRAKQGYYLWVNIRGCAVWDEAGKPVRMCGSLRDVTDRIVSEQVLRIQYEITKTMIGSSDLESFHKIVPELMATVGWGAGSIWLLKPDRVGNQQLTLTRTFGNTYDLYKDPADEDTLGAIKQVMESNKVLYEPTENSLLKRSLFGRSQGFKQVLTFPLQSGDKILGAIEMFHPDTREYRKELLELTGLLSTQIGSLVDRLQVQGKLEERDHQLSSIVDTAPDGIITLCGQEIITANPAAHQIFGFAEGHLVRRTVSEIMPGLAKILSSLDLNSDCLQQMSEVIQLTGLREDGSSVPVEVSISSFKMHGTQMLTAILRDVTERKQMEQRVSDFYSMVSHELRTPITSIKGSLSLMAEGFAGELPELGKELVQIARDESERLLRLINDILDVRKIAEGKLKLRISINDIDELVSTSLDALKGFADHHNITLVKDVQATKRIDCDRDRIIQVLANLISNAVKFSSSNSEVTVRASLNADTVHISVSDRGNGIPDVEMKKLFVPFQQLDCSSTRSKGGSGLGLAISKAIVKEHGGEIGVDSKLGIGTTFWFEIPTVQPLDEH
jgi:PAS domain S-box-containing protein